MTFDLNLKITERSEVKMTITIEFRVKNPSRTSPIYFRKPLDDISYRSKEDTGDADRQTDRQIIHIKQLHPLIMW